nr:DUF5682 family protein [Pseudaestuariivita rosea]
MIAEVQPKHVLIEGPTDFTRQIPLLLHPETKPPVAIVSLITQDNDTRLAAYYPFCAHSPEYIALVEGQKFGAQLSFIDLPAADKSFRNDMPQDQPILLSDDRHFNSGDYITALSKKIGCRDGFELWDHLFESRLGDPDWKTFLQDVCIYCAGIRSTTTAAEIERTGDAAREAHMSAALLDVLGNGPVVVVVGGFHAPALIDAVEAGKAKSPKTSDTADSYLIRYGFAAMDALTGYGAGLPQPGYYQELWQRAASADGTPAWRETATDLISGFAAKMRADGQAFSLPAQVEALRAAEALALLRGRPGAMRHDLIDGIRTSLVKGEVSRNEVWTERFLLYLRGNSLGDVPASAGSPPLVEDARRLARKHRLDISDSAERRRKLDIRRNDRHLEASRFLHAMTLLQSNFARLDIGPDYLTNTRTELLFEEWTYNWSPVVEGRLIELSALGDRVAAACLGYLTREVARLDDEGKRQDISALIELFGRGLLAGLGADLDPFLNRISDSIQNHGTFGSTARALQWLHFIAQSAGPMGAPDSLDLDGVRQAAYQRLIFLCDDLSATPDEEVRERLDAIRLVNELLRNDADECFDRALFDDAMNRVAQGNVPPQILGAVLAICVVAGLRDEDDLIIALQGRFNGASLDEPSRIGVLEGILHTVPALLWNKPALLDVVDDFLQALDEAAFLQILPHLRLAFTNLNPRETDRLADLLARRHGGRATDFTAVQTISEDDLQRGLAIEARLRDQMQADSLLDWLTAGANP